MYEHSFLCDYLVERRSGSHSNRYTRPSPPFPPLPSQQSSLPYHDGRPNDITPSPHGYYPNSTNGWPIPTPPVPPSMMAGYPPPPPYNMPHMRPLYPSAVPHPPPPHPPSLWGTHPQAPMDNHYYRDFWFCKLIIVYKY